MSVDKPRPLSGRSERLSAEEFAAFEAKQPTSFRLSQEAITGLKELSQETGRTQAQMLERLIREATERKRTVSVEERLDYLELLGQLARLRFRGERFERKIRHWTSDQLKECFLQLRGVLFAERGGFARIAQDFIDHACDIHPGTRSDIDWGNAELSQKLSELMAILGQMRRVMTDEELEELDVRG